MFPWLFSLSLYLSLSPLPHTHSPFLSMRLFRLDVPLSVATEKQLVEMDRIQHSLKQLQEAHMLMKQQYEDEIVRLRRQLESHPLKSDPDSRGGVSGTRGSPNFGVAFF